MHGRPGNRPVCCSAVARHVDRTHVAALRLAHVAAAQEATDDRLAGRGLGAGDEAEATWDATHPPDDAK